MSISHLWDLFGYQTPPMRPAADEGAIEMDDAVSMLARQALSTESGAASGGGSTHSTTPSPLTRPSLTNEELDSRVLSSIRSDVSPSDLEEMKDVLKGKGTAGAANDFLALCLDPSIHARMTEELTARMIQRLVSLGADPNIAGKSGETPLHLMVKWNRFEEVQYLLTQGADPNKKAACGDTPFATLVHTYANFKNSKGSNPWTTPTINKEEFKRQLSLLMRHGADLRQTDCIAFAREKRFPADIQTLLNGGTSDEASPSPELLKRTEEKASVEEATQAFLSQLQAAGVADEELDHYSSFFDEELEPAIVKTLFLFYLPLCRKDALPIRNMILDRLIALGVDPNTEDATGTTLLHIFAEDHNLEGIRTLLSKGANPNKQNRDGQTPFLSLIQNYAGCTYYEEKNPWEDPLINRDLFTQEFHLFLEHGADPRQANNEGDSPYSFAMGSGFPAPLLQEMLSHTK